MNIISKNYYSKEELLNIGFEHIGDQVKVSRKTGIYVPEKVWIGNNVTVEAFTKISPNVILLDNVYIGPFCALHGDKGIFLSENVYIESHVCMYSSTSDYSGIYMASAMVGGGEYGGDLGEKIIIEKNAIVSANCCILPGSIIRENVFIMPRSLVKKDTKKNAFYTGIPIEEVVRKKERGV